MSLETLLASVATVMALFSAVMVVWQRSAVISALFLVINLGSVAILFLTLGGEFLAAVQVIVYAGAIMVLFLFVIMLLNPAPPKKRFASGPVVTGLTFGLGVVFVAAMVRGVMSLAGAGEAMTATGPGYGSTRSIGELLFTAYLYPFELTGVLLLVAMVGAVVLARRQPPEEL
jgi:NADH-quinone oxidoreductase subunit J